jgi:flagellar hook-associated protein 3 FlgL
VRVSDSFRYNIYKNNLSALKEKMDKTTSMISSQRKILVPSDDPVAFARNVEIGSQLNANTQYIRNLNSLKTTASYYETSINTITDLMTRVKELATQALSDTMDENGRTIIAEEIDGIIGQLAAVGNTKVGNTYIFGGKQANEIPYTLQPDPDNPTDPDASYYQFRSGSAGVTKVAMDSSTTIDSGIIGSKVFDGAVDIFKTLKTFSNDLKASTTDHASLDADFGDINTFIDETANNLAYVGTYTRKIETFLTANETRELTLTTAASDLMDVDPVSAITDYTALSNAYESSLYIMSKVRDLSILNYLG